MSAMVRRRRTTTDERGFFTIWVLGLCVLVLFLGGVSFDLWHGFAVRRALSSTVDGAAVAGASGVDLTKFKADGTVSLDPNLVQQRVDDYLTAQLDASKLQLDGQPTVTVAGERVTVVAQTRFHYTLLRILVPAQAIEISVTGSADAVEATG